MIGVRLASEGRDALSWRLGALTVSDPADSAPAVPADLTIADRARSDADIAELRLRWTPPTPAAAADVHHYELHQVLPDSRRAFLGGARSTAYYPCALGRSSGEAQTVIEVRSILAGLEASAAIAVRHRW